jgi:putative ABC transport system permease protein
VATLFLGKALVLGLVGGAIGCVVGILMERYLSQSMFQIAPAMQGLNADLIVLALLGAPLVAAMASYLPAIVASRQDPAVVLMDE